MVYTTNKRSVKITRKPHASSTIARLARKRTTVKDKKSAAIKHPGSGVFITSKDIDFITDLAENPRPNEGLRRLVDRVRALKAAAQ